MGLVGSDHIAEHVIRRFFGFILERVADLVAVPGKGFLLCCVGRCVVSLQPEPLAQAQPRELVLHGRFACRDGLVEIPIQLDDGWLGREAHDGVALVCLQLHHWVSQLPVLGDQRIVVPVLDPAQIKQHARQMPALGQAEQFGDRARRLDRGIGMWDLYPPVARARHLGLYQRRCYPAGGERAAEKALSAPSQSGSFDNLIASSLDSCSGRRTCAQLAALMVSKNSPHLSGLRNRL